jgi:hypothetical protein
MCFKKGWRVSGCFLPRRSIFTWRVSCQMCAAAMPEQGKMCFEQGQVSGFFLKEKYDFA